MQKRVLFYPAWILWMQWLQVAGCRWLLIALLLLSIPSTDKICTTSQPQLVATKSLVSFAHLPFVPANVSFASFLKQHLIAAQLALLMMTTATASHASHGDMQLAIIQTSHLHHLVGIGHDWAVAPLSKLTCAPSSTTPKTSQPPQPRHHGAANAVYYGINIKIPSFVSSWCKLTEWSI